VDLCEDVATTMQSVEDSIYLQIQHNIALSSAKQRRRQSRSASKTTSLKEMLEIPSLAAPQLLE
jgi:hypothetical protein